MTIRPYLRLSFWICWLAIGAVACKQGPESVDVYKQIEVGAAKNDKDQIYEIDAANSVISWTYAYEDGQSISGKIRPTLGSLIIENEMITAGFVELDVLQSKADPQTNPSILNVLKKALADSVPILTTTGRKIRLDIAQAERQINRSEFNVTNSTTDSLNSFLLSSNLEVADSTRIVSLTVSLQINSKHVSVTGSYLLNPSEFGIKKLGTSKNGYFTNPQIRLVYTLRFRSIS